MRGNVSRSIMLGRALREVLQPPRHKPKAWARVTLQALAYVKIGRIHVDWRCSKLQCQYSNSASMIVPISGPLVPFLGRCPWCCPKAPTPTIKHLS